MVFANPILLLLPLIALAFLLIPSRTKQRVAFPDISILNQVGVSFRQQIRLPLLATLLLAAIILLAMAAARPQKVMPIIKPYQGRDLILALDISGSMKEYDFKSERRTISRLDAVKLVVAEFVKARAGDRIGLVIFGSQSFVQSPLTVDHELLTQLISLLQVGIAGDGTAIGDGLGASLARLKDIDGDSKAIILLTDGVNNSGQVNPIQAAKIAAELGIKIHTVGIGSTAPGRYRSPLNAFQGKPEFDEDTLKKIAELTGGVYFNANDLAGLKAVYTAIDKLESSESNEPNRENREELFAPFALAGAFLLLCYAIFSETIFRKLP